MSLKKKKLTRQTASNLFIALEICKALDVPSKFRYAIARNQTILEPDRKATQAAFPEPDIKEAVKALEAADTEEAKDAVRKQFQEQFKAHSDWQTSLEPHLKEEVEFELFETDLVEIDDTVNISEPGPRRERQNQILIESLMPIFRD